MLVNVLTIITESGKIIRHIMQKEKRESMNKWKKLGAVLLASVLLLSGCAKAPTTQ